MPSQILSRWRYDEEYCRELTRRDRSSIYGGFHLHSLRDDAVMADAAIRMDRQYRWQRHIYDVTRLPYLLGRDRLIAELVPPPGAHVLEIGCGTGRNLIHIARTYPGVECFGIDVSNVMLDDRAAIDRARRPRGPHPARAGRRRDGRSGAAVRPSRVRPDHDLLCALDDRAVAPGPGACGGAARRRKASLCLVDFGDQAGMPAWFRVLLFRWLDWFHVSPRLDLKRELERLANRADLKLRVCDLYRGYAWLAQLERAG